MIETIETNEYISTTCTEDPLLPQNSAIKEHSIKWKDMPPIDIPNAAGIVINGPKSQTPCMTRDVANIIPSQTNNIVGDIVNDPQYHTGEAIDATGDVVNDQPSCNVKYDKLWTKISRR